jgi:hypothetical protein
MDVTPILHLQEQEGCRKGRRAGRDNEEV